MARKGFWGLKELVEDEDEEAVVVVVVSLMGVEAAERSLRRKALVRPSDISGD
jgi:hypothetical protein